jgi:glycosyltransferase involved in cell wall biosynthesis
MATTIRPDIRLRATTAASTGRALIVIPTYEEHDNIERILPAIRRAVPDVDILVVDDSSPDDTASCAVELAERLGSIDVMVRPAKAGLGSAYRDGFRYGIERGYALLVEMDADLSHDPEALGSLLEPFERDPEVSLVVGSRYVSGGSIPDWSRGRRMLSQMGNRYASAALGFDVADATSGFRAYRTTALEAVDLDAVRADGYGFQIEMVYRVHMLGGKIVEMPIAFTDRTDGESKMSSSIVFEALGLVTGWAVRDRVLRWRKPNGVD